MDELETTDFRPVVVISKINEIVEWINAYENDNLNKNSSVVENTESDDDNEPDA